MGYKVGTHKSLSTNICGDSIINIGVLDPIDTIDITYVDWRTILPKDTVNFKTAQEEYEFLRDCNRVKYEIDSLQMLCIDVIDALLYDGFDPDQQVSLSQIEDALINNDYFHYLEQIDSIINKECN